MSPCSSSCAFGMISLSTKVLTVDRISCWMSVKSAVCARRVIGVLSNGKGGGSAFGWGEGRRPLHAGGAALAGDDQGHLAAGLVDHLVAEHGRALLSPLLRGRPLVGVQDQLGVVVVLLRRRVDLVGRVDLAGVQHPLA